MRVKRLSRCAALTLTELLVVVVVISLLATIAVPVYTNQAAKARLALTLSEEKEIAEAEQHVAIDIGYYVRLYALNDGFTGDTIPNCSLDSKLGGVYDNGITNAINSLQIYHRSSEIFLSTDNGLPPTNGIALFAQLIKNETGFGWDGPYLNWHRDRNQNDWPDDPWGNDYMLFTVDGAIYAPPDSSDPFRYFPLTGAIVIGQGPEFEVSPIGGGVSTVTVTRRFNTGRLFDKPTILSLGPNGLPGNGTNDTNDGYGQGDDIFYSFAGWKGQAIIP